MLFEELLKRAGITKAELARKLGITPNTISTWKGEQPQYATAYLDLLIAFNRIAP